MRSRGDVVREGIILGIIGYMAVAIFYAFLDLLAGRGATFTLNLMGQVVFRGARDPAILQLPIPSDVGAMVMYNFLHLGVALAVGCFVAWLVSQVEERPELGIPVLGLLLAGYLVTISAIRAITQTVAPLLPFWSIVVANSLVALGGCVYLWWAHPKLRTRDREISDRRAAGDANS